MRLQQGGKVLRLKLLDHVVGQARKQLRQAQTHDTPIVPNVPRQFIGVCAAPVHDHSGCRPRLATIPCRAITLFKLGAEHERVFVQHDLEATAAQLGQQTLVQQDVVRIAGHPQPIEISCEAAENSFNPLAHVLCVFLTLSPG